MRLNPEFRRNLWLELSPVRLVAMPLVLGLAFAGAYLLRGDWTHVGETAVWLYLLIAVAWGTYRAAAAIGEEVNAHTWDAQRISSLGAWPMTWGKLFGATAFAWYGGLICLVVRVGATGLTNRAIPPGFEDRLGDVGIAGVLLHSLVLIALALLAQALALGIALALHRKNRSGKALPVFLCQMTALLVVAVTADQIGLVLLLDVQAPIGTVAWFGWQLPELPFAAVAGAAFAAWAVVGVYRLMRVELQFRNSPLVLLAFMAFTVVFLEGYVAAECAASGLCAGYVVPWLLPVIGVSATLVYATLFLDRKDAITWRAILAGARIGDLHRLATGLPMWATPLVVGAAGVLVLCLLAGSSGVESAALRFMARFDFEPGLAVWPVFAAGLCFVIRDIGIVLFCNFRRGARRPDMTAAVMLAVLYVVVGSLLSAIGSEGVQVLAWPWPHENPLVTIAPPLVQAVAIWIAAIWRAGRLTRIAPAAIPGPAAAA